ncbi:phosphoglycerate mutase family protein [Namhaeicola litoreus]|uniref:Phosphoglycerate mutase family protein n=1 Tax=Namhaeicola litoreus TaxID=1052145 RepID=A0ABW3Y1S2_9FLAO
MLQKIIFIFLLSSFSLSILAQETTIILVRHAETFEGGSERMLNEVGKKRALELKRTLQNVKLDAIYSTDLNRTKQTVHPISLDRGLEIIPYDPTNLNDFAYRLLKNHVGETILVSGHSNTTPQLVNALIGDKKYDDFDETEFYHLFILSFATNLPPKVLQLSYGF